MASRAGCRKLKGMCRLGASSAAVGAKNDEVVEGERGGGGGGGGVGGGG